LIGITIVLAALVSAVYYYFTKPSETMDVVQPAKTDEIQPTPAVAPALPQQAMPSPAPYQAPTQPTSPLQIQPQPSTPPRQSAGDGGSAQDMLRNRVVEPETLTPPVSTTVQPKPRPKPKPAAKPQTEPSNPQSSGNSGPSWVIIPGGARKTD